MQGFCLTRSIPKKRIDSFCWDSVRPFGFSLYVTATESFPLERQIGRTTSVSLVAPMKKRYDFSKSVRNPYLRKAKKRLTIRLDEDTISYFRAMAEKNGVPYQNLINLYLRDCAQSDRKLSMKWE